MKRKKEKMFLRSCGFPENLYKFIEKMADLEQTSFNEIVRYALGEYKKYIEGDKNDEEDE